MSSARGNKFQDHYAVLEVDAKADQTTLLAAYSNLVAKYHPTRGTTPDAEKFKAITTANEVLSDPSSRAAFDQLRGNPQKEEAFRFSGAAFFEKTDGEPTRRLAILCLLYDRARQFPTRPGLSFRQTEAILTMSGDEMRFAMVYLKARGLAIADDKSNLLITVDGMDYVEKSTVDPVAIAALLSGKEAPPEEAEGVAPDKAVETANEQAGPALFETPAEVPEAQPAPEPPKHEPTQSENLAARIRNRMAIPRPPAAVR